MPCAGPAMPSEQAVDIVFNEVVSYLQEKHDLMTMPEEALKNFMRMHRQKALYDLREAIKEFMNQSACEDFLMDPVGYEHSYWREPGHQKESFLDYEEWTEGMRQGRWHINERESRFTTNIVFIKSVPLYDIKKIQIEEK